MKAVFGILALVVVLAVVASVAKHQLHGVGCGASTARNAAAANGSGAFSTRPVEGGAPAALPGAIAADPNGETVPQQARELQDRARAETTRALEEGAERNRRADP